MRPRTERIFSILLLSVIPTLLLWLPFYLQIQSIWTIPLPQEGMATVVANYDGPIYAALAKTFYNLDEIRQNFSFALPLEYYAAHFPLYPLLIRASSYLFGYLYGMLFVTVVSSFFALYYFYLLAKQHVDSNIAMWMTVVFSVFPARWLIVRSVGSPEPLFIGAVIASAYYFKSRKYLFAGLFGVIAQLTKSPGILLFIAYVAALIIPSFPVLATAGFSKYIKSSKVLKSFPLLLIPSALIAVFYFYRHVFGNFFAYFTSGDNIHLFFPPFQVFNFEQPWVGTYWLEDIVYIYLISAIGLIRLFQQKRYEIGFVVLVFLASIAFVSHRDVARYILPAVPFLLVSYSDFIASKTFKYAFIAIIIPVFLFSMAFISQNVMPISDWTPFL